MFGKHGFVAIPQTHRCLLKSRCACSAACPPASILDVFMVKGSRLALNNKTKQASKAFASRILETVAPGRQWDLALGF